MRSALAAVAMVACSSPPAPTLVARLYDATDLQSRGDTLFFQARGYVWSVPGDGSGPATQLAASGCDGLRVDATSIYFFAQPNADATCDLMSAPSAGGTPVVLAASIGPGRLELAGSAVIVVNRDVTSVPVAGGPPTVIGPVDPMIAASATSIDAANIYWKANADPERQDAKCGQQPLSGALAIRWPCTSNAGFAAANNIYVASSHCVQGFECGTLYKDYIGGRGKPIAHSDSNGIYGLVLDGDHVYWNNTVRIVRSTLSGDDETVIAEQNAPTVDASILDFTVDDQYVYWATDYNSVIWRSPK